jgi:hypothetical protein
MLKLNAIRSGMMSKSPDVAFTNDSSKRKGAGSGDET